MAEARTRPSRSKKPSVLTEKQWCMLKKGIAAAIAVGVAAAIVHHVKKNKKKAILPEE
jgi:hypothetical protein